MAALSHRHQTSSIIIFQSKPHDTRLCNSFAHSIPIREYNSMTSSTALISTVKLGALMAVLALCGLIGSSMTSVAPFEREVVYNRIIDFFRRRAIFTEKVDAGAEETFYLSQNEWKLFEVYQEPQFDCSCTITCADPSSRVDVYLTFNPRVRFNDNWDGWACKETTASNSQVCSAVSAEPGIACYAAVRGDRIYRGHQACTVLCNIDTDLSWKDSSQDASRIAIRSVADILTTPSD